MTRLRYGLAAAILGLALTAPLTGQSPAWFQDASHDKKNRWEGLLGRDHGSPVWELRSFVGDVEPYPMNAPVDLTVSYYVPDATDAFIEGRDVNDVLHYLMQPKPDFLQKTQGWRSFRGWSTADVLIPKAIVSTNLGVLIRLGGDSAAVNRLAPAIVRYSGPPTAMRKYRLDVFTAKAVGSFHFDVVDANNRKQAYGDQPAVGDRGVIHLAFDAPMPEGRTRIVMTAPYADSPYETLDMECVFFHKVP